jgi:transcriptional regulator with XRE-family HTH domain
MDPKKNDRLNLSHSIGRELGMNAKKCHLEDYSYKDQLEHVGSTIQNARKYRKITQSQLANLSNLSPKMISMIECGNRGISLSALQRILTILKFSVAFYPTEMKLMPEDLGFMINELIPKLRELLTMLERIKGIQ